MASPTGIANRPTVPAEGTRPTNDSVRGNESPALLAIRLLQESLVELGKRLEDMGKRLEELRHSEPSKTITVGEGKKKHEEANPAHATWESALSNLMSAIDDLRNKVIPSKQKDLEDAKSKYEAEKAAKATRSQESKDAESNMEMALARQEAVLERLKLRASQTGEDPLIASLRSREELSRKDVIVTRDDQKRRDFAKESASNALPLPGHGRFTEPEPHAVELDSSKKVGGAGKSST